MDFEHAVVRLQRARNDRRVRPRRPAAWPPRPATARDPDPGPAAVAAGWRRRILRPGRDHQALPEKLRGLWKCGACGKRGGADQSERPREDVLVTRHAVPPGEPSKDRGAIILGHLASRHHQRRQGPGDPSGPHRPSNHDKDVAGLASRCRARGNRVHFRRQRPAEGQVLRHGLRLADGCRGLRAGDRRAGRAARCGERALSRERRIPTSSGTCTVSWPDTHVPGRHGTSAPWRSLTARPADKAGRPCCLPAKTRWRARSGRSLSETAASGTTRSSITHRFRPRSATCPMRRSSRWRIGESISPIRRVAQSRRD